MANLILATARLDLVPMTPDFLRASLAHDTAACQRILTASAAAEEAGAADSIVVPELWPGPEYQHALELRLGQLTADPTLQPWLMRAIVHRDTRTMVGDIGFHTAPAPEYLQEWSPQAVELGFSVFPAYQRQGMAREAVRAMMHWAHSVHGVPAFILSIRPDNHPSQALAASLGFSRIGQHEDEIDGTEEVLELVVGR